MINIDNSPTNSTDLLDFHFWELFLNKLKFHSSYLTPLFAGKSSKKMVGNSSTV